MIIRSISKQLKEWKCDEEHKPLILRGARQVGKTTLINDFGQSFENYLYFNLDKKSDRLLFEMEYPLNELVNLLFTRTGKIRAKGSTLIFIDEIQNSPQAINLLRYFYEERRDIHVVAAGSLLENVVDVGCSFPVGRVEFLPLRPCSFLEFAQSMGRENMIEIIKQPLYSIPFHTELMALFNQYCLVGGMPKAVQHYVDNGNIMALNKIYSNLLKAYMDDVEKYTRKGKTNEIVRYIIKYGWMQAGATITLGSFNGSDYKSREAGEAFRLLEKAMLLELAYPTTQTITPAMPDLKRMPKLFWFDTGLVNYVGNVRREMIGSDAIHQIWRGRIAEQIVAQELLTLNNDINQTRRFWTKGHGSNGAEVDFVWMVDSEVIPIEVKTGHNSHLRSLHSFMEETPLDVAVRVWSGPFSVDHVVTANKKKPFKLINLPFYLIWNLENIVRKEL